MMKTQSFTSAKLSIFGEFLQISYSKVPDLDRLTVLAKAILSDMELTRALAGENRIITNIVAIFVETPKLFAILDSDQKLSFKRAYMENWRDAELTKRQILEFSNELAHQNKPPILMIKGGLRLFDNLYPTVAHRYMADIDLAFADPSALAVLGELHYVSDLPEEFDLSNFTLEYLEWQKLRNHHLPPVFSPDHPRRIEMHQHLVHLRAKNYCRENTFDRGKEIPKLPKIMAPHPVDQLVLNLLHMKYGDMFTDYANFRLRNIFEGYLLYKQLELSQVEAFEKHFQSIQRFDDVVFWKYLCYRLLRAQEFEDNYPLRIKCRFALHARFGQNSKANAFSYSLHFLYRLLGREVWSTTGRRTLLKKLHNVESRQVFWNKIMRIFKH